MVVAVYEDYIALTLDDIIREENMKNYLKDGNKLWLSGTVAISCLLFLMILFCATSQSLWYDEVFSLDIVNSSWSQMIETAKADVHPPLYYFILKLWISAGRMAGFNDIFIAKLFSFVPFLLIFFGGGNKIQKEHGYKTALLFELCVAGMPNLLNYALEIRTYSWALFFVTTAFLYGYDIVTYEKRSAWVYFTVYSILAAYAHYFSAISVIAIYFGVLFICRGGSIWRRWLLSVACAFVAYIPWLFVFVKQFGSVVNDFWIPEITRSTVLSYLKYPLEPSISRLNVGLILGASIGVAYVVLFIIQLLKKGKKRQDIYMLTGFAVALFTVTVGIIASLLFRPVFVPRYMIPVLGCFWMCLSWLVTYTKNRWIAVATVALIAVISFIDIVQVVRWEEIRRGYYEDIAGFWEKIPDNDIILTDNKGMEACLDYYLSQEVIYVSSVEELQKIYSRAQENNSIVWYYEVETEEAKRELLSNMMKKYPMQKSSEFILEYSRLEVFRIG